MIQDLSQSSPIGCSNHVCLHWSFLCREVSLEATSTNKCIYAKDDYNSMINFLNRVDWDDLFSNTNIETNWHHFKNLLTTAIEQFVPTVPMSSQKSKPPWWTKSLASAIAKNVNYI